MAELTAAEYEELRDSTSRPIQEARAQLVADYATAQRELEDQHHQDLKDNDQDLREAYVAAGLNSDGTNPQGRPTG